MSVDLDGTLLCDPSFLATRTGRVWIDRAIRDGFGRWVSAPQAFFMGPTDEPRWFSPFGSRSRQDVWGCEVPEVVLIEDAVTVDPIGRALRDKGDEAAVQVWCGLLSGAVLACRRPKTLDSLVAAGAVIMIERGDESRVRAALPSGLTWALAGAAARRTRYLCRMPRTEGEADRVHVLDLGPWSDQGSRSAFTAAW